MRMRDRASLAARPILVFDDPQQRAHVLDGEAELAAATDERHAVDVGVTIAPLSAAPARTR